jgi:hypothetical protein
MTVFLRDLHAASTRLRQSARAFVVENGLAVKPQNLFIGVYWRSSAAQLWLYA